jgi:hypothetical protein
MTLDRLIDVAAAAAGLPVDRNRIPDFCEELIERDAR